ncbi:unnamed protein product, partial [Ectocarpus sp. 6 AP-2014]
AGSPAATGVAPPTSESAGDAEGKAAAPPNEKGTCRAGAGARAAVPPKAAAPGPSSTTRGRRRQRHTRKPVRFANAYVGSSDDSEVPNSRESADSNSSSDDGSEP